MYTKQTFPIFRIYFNIIIHVCTLTVSKSCQDWIAWCTFIIPFLIVLFTLAGVSQVKWNKRNCNLLATTHDGDIRIWDTRVRNSLCGLNKLTKTYNCNFQNCIDGKLGSSIHGGSLEQQCQDALWTQITDFNQNIAQSAQHSGCSPMSCSCLFNFF